MSITNEGFIRPTFEEILVDVQANAISKFDDGGTNTPNVEPESWLGAMTAIIAESINGLYKTAEDIYYALYLSTASGVSLDRAALPTLRVDAKKSTTLFRFVRANLTLLQVDSGFVVERDDGVSYVTIEDGVFVGSNAAVDVLAQAVDPGPGGNAPVNSIKFIPVPLDNLDSVSNTLPATGGEEVETDSSFRARAISNKSADRTSSLPAIENKLRETDGVLDVKGFENTDKSPVDGRPGVSIEMVVDGGTDEDVAQAIYETKAAGVETFGDITVQVTDPTNGQVFDISFSRVSKRPVNYRVLLFINSGYDAGISEPFIRQALLDYTGGVNPSGIESQGTSIGEDVEHWKAQASLFNPNEPFGLAGVASLEVFLEFTVPVIGQADLIIEDKQQAFTDFGTIQVQTLPAP